MVTFSLIANEWIVYREFVPPGQTVNQKFYVQVFEYRRQRIHHEVRIVPQ